jgi:hypothetical protein
MYTSVNCSTCKFGDWGVRGPLPCKDCLGYHKWLPRLKHLSVPKPCPPMISLVCRGCNNMESTRKYHPITGFAYSTGWVVRCSSCGASMKEINNEPN